MGSVGGLGGATGGGGASDFSGEVVGREADSSRIEVVHVIQVWYDCV